MYVCGVLVFGMVPALAQVSLPRVLQQVAQGAEWRNQNTLLVNAKADLAAKEADPSMLVVPLTQAKNTAVLEAAKLEHTRLSANANVITAYTSLFEAQENTKLQAAQVALDERSLAIAKARLQARNGTQLDIDKAANALALSRQNMADAKASLPILSARLGVLVGQNISVTLAPPITKNACRPESLEQGLENRLPSLLQAAQMVALGKLNVQLSDNEYTAPAVLRDYKASLENAQRSLDISYKTAQTNLQDAWRSVQNAAEQLEIRSQDAANAGADFAQAQTRLKGGTISQLQLQQTELLSLRAALQKLQAQNNYLKALAQLSLQGGLDCTGIGANK
jgi:outer membrane protein